MLTGLKVWTFENIGKTNFLRQRVLRKQFKTFVMADPDNEAVESSHELPTWALGLAQGLQSQEINSISQPLLYPNSNVNIGNLFISQYKPGQAEAELVPSFVPLSVTGLEIRENSVVFSEKGIGGAPDLLRMLASNCKRIVETPLKEGGKSFEIEYPLYRKVVVGIDDTDSSSKGATFSTALSIAAILERALKDVKFLRLTLSLNWPKNPAKTTNNASTALVFSVKPGIEEELITEFIKLAKKYTISKETGMAVTSRVRAPELLKTYARKVKTVHVDVSEAYKVAEQTGVRAIPITGERGLIGAISAVGLVDQPGEAITPIGQT